MGSVLAPLLPAARVGAIILLGMAAYLCGVVGADHLGEDCDGDDG